MKNIFYSKFDYTKNFKDLIQYIKNKEKNISDLFLQWNRDENYLFYTVNSNQYFIDLTKHSKYFEFKDLFYSKKIIEKFNTRGQIIRFPEHLTYQNFLDSQSDESSVPLAILYGEKDKLVNMSAAFILNMNNSEKWGDLKALKKLFKLTLKYNIPILTYNKDGSLEIPQFKDFNKKFDIQNIDIKNILNNLKYKKQPLDKDYIEDISTIYGK